MRKYLILVIVLIVSACSQTDAGKGLVLTVAPPSGSNLPDLTVSSVSLRWSQVWQCGVDVYVTVANHGTADAGEFTLSLQTLQQTVFELGANAQHTVVFNVTGEQMGQWMEASGTVDVTDIVAEADESNNDYRHPLPYSAVPGMESIAICTATKNAEFTPTPTYDATLTPSPNVSYTPSVIPYPNSATLPVGLYPNLRVISVRNTYVPTNCWIDRGAGNRHVVWVEIMNDGQVPVPEYVVRLNGADMRYQNLGVDETRRFEYQSVGGGQLLQVELDPLNQIAETNETDNNMERHRMTFTPPPDCTKTPTMSPT